MKHEAPCKITEIKYKAAHGALGGAPLIPSSYIKDPRYAAEIETQEVESMFQIITKANSFLKQAGIVNESVVP